MRRPHAVAVAAVLSSVLVVVPALAGAQEPTTTEPPQVPPTTTTPGPGAPPTTGTVPSTTAPPPSTPPPGAVPPTTSPAPGDGETPADGSVPAPGYVLPPEWAADPRAPVLFDPSPADGGEVPVGQQPFDPGTNAVLLERVAEMRANLDASKAELRLLQARMLEQQAVVSELVDELGALGQAARRNVAEAAAAQEALRSHATEAFMTGSTDDKLAVVRTADPVQLGVARELLGAVAEKDVRVLERHRRAQAGLDRWHRSLADALATAKAELLEVDTAFKVALADSVAAAQAVAAYENGSQVYVRGFVFPVQGPVEFIDSWGYPRMMGTASAHWHQGTDIFAPRGTPLLASESGTLDRIGTASLGGLRLWVKGDSGTHYYYAHLSAFAEGISNGMRVNAGDVVGFVGDTGNARGTPPHLHFEVHPGGGGPVNPYPLLRATYGAKPMVQIVEAPTLPAEATTDPALLGELGLGEFVPDGDAALAGG